MYFIIYSILLQIENFQQSFALEMGTATFGGIVGYSAGFAIKKVFKLALLIIGLLFVLSQVLAHYEILVINWFKIQELLNSYHITDSHKMLTILTMHLPVTGGFTAGFILGFKKG